MPHQEAGLRLAKKKPINVICDGADQHRQAKLVCVRVTPVTILRLLDFEKYINRYSGQVRNSWQVGCLFSSMKSFLFALESRQARAYSMLRARLLGSKFSYAGQSKP